MLEKIKEITAESLGAEIPSEDLEQIQTVGDVVKYLEAHK